jgi:hypothetical protein
MFALRYINNACPRRAVERALIGVVASKTGFDIFQFPFRFNPGTNGVNVEMGLINKSYAVTLSQRVQG